jgi:glycosyltransferase involved in cell wall biosynthesis
MTASVVICCYTMARWVTLTTAIDEVRSQLRPDDELVVVVDHEPKLVQALTERYVASDVVITVNRNSPGLSHARNAGIDASSGDVVVFLDDDAVPQPGWLKTLLQPLTDDDVAGVGGAVEPDWAAAKPGWFPLEFGWVVGCDYSGLPEGPSQIRNPLGASMAIRRSVFTEVGRFSSVVGRVGTLPFGCEETELCIRASAHNPRWVFVREPASVVRHVVPSTRTTLRYFVRRCYAEGRSKAAIAASAGQQAALTSERSYVRSVLPRGVAHGVRDLFRGDVDGLLRAAAIVVGLMTTAAGYLRGRI